MTDGNDAPNVKIIPPLVYLAGIIIGFLATIGLPTRVVPNSVAWTVGGILTFCGADLAGSALFKFKDVGTTVRPDHAASTLVITGPYELTRNPMYLGLVMVNLGLSFLIGNWWNIILLPLLLLIIQEYIIKKEEKYLVRKFGQQYIDYSHRVRRWL